MIEFEKVLLKERPQSVIVVGDVNSTIACALVNVKMRYDNTRRPVLAHVESGLRSFDRDMPEEINRILTDSLSDILFVSEPSGVGNLLREGINRDRIHFGGNVMIDSLIEYKQKAFLNLVLMHFSDKIQV